MMIPSIVMWKDYFCTAVGHNFKCQPVEREVSSAFLSCE